MSSADALSSLSTLLWGQPQPIPPVISDVPGGRGFLYTPPRAILVRNPEGAGNRACLCNESVKNPSRKCCAGCLSTGKPTALRSWWRSGR